MTYAFGDRDLQLYVILNFAAYLLLFSVFMLVFFFKYKPNYTEHTMFIRPLWLLHFARWKLLHTLTNVVSVPRNSQPLLTRTGIEVFDMQHTNNNLYGRMGV